MIKKIFVSLLMFNQIAYAGLITHTDYTSGNTITAAGQNANENIIVNEINGNLDSNNISNGGIVTTNIANGTITGSNLNANIVITSATVTTLNITTMTVLGTNTPAYSLIYSSTVFQTGGATTTSASF